MSMIMSIMMINIISDHYDDNDDNPGDGQHEACSEYFYSTCTEHQVWNNKSESDVYR